MALIIGAVLALLAVMVAAYPFLVRRSSTRAAGAPDVSGPEANGAEGQSPGQASAPSGSDGPAVQPVPGGPDGPEGLNAIYEAIRTLQLERELGNVPEGLYREQLDIYRLQAAQMLREYERLQSGDMDWTLEEEIRLARAGLKSPSAPGRTCANCGRPLPEEASDCSECSASAGTGPDPGQ